MRPGLRTRTKDEVMEKVHCDPKVQAFYEALINQIDQDPQDSKSATKYWKEFKEVLTHSIENARNEILEGDHS